MSGGQAQDPFRGWSWMPGSWLVAGGHGGYLFAVLADVVGGDVGIELADGGEDDVAHDGVAEFGGEDGEAGGAGAGSSCAR